MMVQGANDALAMYDAHAEFKKAEDQEKQITRPLTPVEETTNENQVQSASSEESRQARELEQRDPGVHVAGPRNPEAESQTDRSQEQREPPRPELTIARTDESDPGATATKLRAAIAAESAPAEPQRPEREQADDSEVPAKANADAARHYQENQTAVAPREEPQNDTLDMIA